MARARRAAPPPLQHPPLAWRVGPRFDALTPVAAIRNLKRRREADAFLLSFPKTGRTWVRVMLAQLLAVHYGRPELASLAPLPRIDGGPGVLRIVVRHDGNPHKCTPDEIAAHRREYAGCRVMLLVRDPRDAIVSNYFQVTRRDHWFDGDIGTYLRWPRGSLDSMLRYYSVWARQRHVPAAFLLLRYEDRNSMAFGIEARLPFLDYRIVEFALTMPDEYKISNGWQKYILRKAMHDLPEKIRYRKDKKGFLGYAV